MRRILIERDGRECQNCHGACHLRSDGLKCQLVSNTLPLVTYWRLDALRESQPYLRLQVHHTEGKDHEEWDKCVTLCPCCHAKATQGGGAVHETVTAYLATVGEEPPEYTTARLQEQQDKPVRKAKRKAKAKAARKAVKAKREKVEAKKPSRFGKKKEAQKARASLAIPMRYSSLDSKSKAQSERRNWNVY